MTSTNAPFFLKKEQKIQTRKPLVVLLPILVANI